MAVLDRAALELKGRVDRFLSVPIGNGSGNGNGDGDGYGYGDGDGRGYSVAVFCGLPVHMIDGVQTSIATARGNIAKGWILKSDLTRKPCYVAKAGSHFAHGETIEEAVRDAQKKAFNDLPVEERLAQFWESHNRTDRYPASDLYDWHGRLTASCEMGRKQFVADRGIDLATSTYTVAEFVALCDRQYGHEIIKRLEDN